MSPEERRIRLSPLLDLYIFADKILESELREAAKRMIGNVIELDTPIDARFLERVYSDLEQDDGMRLEVTLSLRNRVKRDETLGLSPLTETIQKYPA